MFIGSKLYKKIQQHCWEYIKEARKNCHLISFSKHTKRYKCNVKRYKQLIWLDREIHAKEKDNQLEQELPPAPVEEGLQ